MFSGITVISIWWFSSKRKGKSKKTEKGKGSVHHLPNNCHSLLKSPRRSVQSSRRPKSKVQSLAVQRGKALPRCPKSTLSKVRRCQKKSQNLAGNWLDRAWDSEASDSSGRVPWPSQIETNTRHVPDPSPESDSSRFTCSTDRSLKGKFEGKWISHIC